MIKSVYYNPLLFCSRNKKCHTFVFLVLLFFSFSWFLVCKTCKLSFSYSFRFPFLVTGNTNYNKICKSQRWMNRLLSNDKKSKNKPNMQLLHWEIRNINNRKNRKAAMNKPIVDKHICIPKTVIPSPGRIFQNAW